MVHIVEDDAERRSSRIDNRCTRRASKSGYAIEPEMGTRHARKIRLRPVEASHEAALHRVLPSDEDNRNLRWGGQRRAHSADVADDHGALPALGDGGTGAQRCRAYPPARPAKLMLWARLSRAYAVVGREIPSGEFSGRLSSFAPSWTDCASITAGRFRADAINASETDCLAGHVGFEPANPSASYLIGILKRDF
jgi:hypothetical protein